MPGFSLTYGVDILLHNEVERDEVLAKDEWNSEDEN